MPSLRFTVDGDPVPQPKIQKGRYGIYERDKGQRAANWRSMIVKKARETMLERGVKMAPQYVPVTILMVFHLSPPKTIPKIRQKLSRDLPTTVPDNSNLAYLVENALKGICYYDDAQIVDKHELKYYAWESEPGVDIVITW